MNKKSKGLKIFFLVLMLFMLTISQLRAAEPKVKFAIDINRLDKILSFFLNSIPAGNWMDELDRYDEEKDGDLSVEFNIFDVDDAINEFLNPPMAVECSGADECGEHNDGFGWSCETKDDTEIKYCVQCHEDGDCGEGAHCKDNMCRKSCGLLSGGSAYTDCYGRNKECDVKRGECYEVSDTRTACQMDGDCLGGNYCMLGQCEPLCYRSLDCPGTEWMCSKHNRCVMRPNDPSLAPVDYSDYQVMFGTKAVIMKSDMPFIEIPVVIMNKETRTEVIDDPRLKIPFRLKMKYHNRKTPECEIKVGMEEDKIEEIKERCKVESFLRMGNAVGVLDGKSGQTIKFTYDDYLFRKLSPGDYTVDVDLMAGTGNISSATLEYRNPSISGHYLGDIVLSEPTYSGRPTIGLNLNLTESIVQWDTLLNGNEVIEDENGRIVEHEIDVKTALPIVESFDGQFVWGEIITSESSLFNNTTAEREKDEGGVREKDVDIFEVEKSVPFVGIYMPDGNKVRLIFELNMARNFTTLDTEEGSHLTYENFFKRPIRRMVIISGKLNSITRKLTGLYRESIYGIADKNTSYTVGGNIEVGQISSFGNNNYPEDGFLKIGMGKYNEEKDFNGEEAFSEFSFDDYLSGYEEELRLFVKYDLPVRVNKGELKKCAAHLNCGNGLVCDPRMKRCVKLLECDEDKKCGKGLVCDEVRNICQKSEGCSDDTECDSGFFCLEEAGQCAKVGSCDDRNPCPTGFVCDSSSKVCEKLKSCNMADDAPRGLRCEESLSLFDNSCEFDTECGDGLKCDKDVKKCIEREVCYSDTDCAKGLVCNEEFNRCVKREGCEKDAECGANHFCMEDENLGKGACVKSNECQENSDCTKGFVCDKPSSICVFRSSCDSDDDCSKGFRCDDTIDQCVKYSECYDNEDCERITIPNVDYDDGFFSNDIDYVSLQGYSCNKLTSECVKSVEKERDCGPYRVYDPEVKGCKRDMKCKDKDDKRCEDVFGGGYFCDGIQKKCVLKQDCSDKLDCFDGFVCNEEIKKCVPKSECKSNDDCTIPGTYCDMGLEECTMGNKCLTDSQCLTDSICDSDLNLCVKLESCGGNGQCEKGFVCESDTDICLKTNKCNVSSDCSDGFECNGTINRCQKLSECSDSTQCMNGFICHPEKKLCVKRDSCESDLECGEGSYCNRTVNECVTIDKCSDDFSCKSGFSCNTGSGICVKSSDCFSDSECGDGFACHKDLHECMKIKSDSGINFREELETYERTRFGSVISLETKIASAIRSLKGKISQIDIEDTLEDQAKLCEDGDCDDGLDTKIDMRKLVAIAHAYGKVIRDYNLAPPSDSSRHNKVSRSKRFALTHRFLHFVDEILIAYNYAAGDMVAKGFRLFLKGVTEEKSGGKTFSEYDYTIAALKYHEKAREFLYDPYIQETFRSIQNIPYNANPEGKTIENGVPAYEYSTELGTMGVEQGVLKRPFDHMLNTVNTLSKYLSLQRRRTGVIDPRYRTYLDLLTQELYLEATTLIYLQEGWEGDNIKYANTHWIETVLNDTAKLKVKLDMSKNPLGYDPDRVFFSFIKGHPDCISYHAGETEHHEYFQNEFRCRRDKAQQKLDKAFKSYMDERSTKQSFDERLANAREKYMEQIEHICGGDTEYLDSFCGPMDEVTIDDLEYKCENESCSDVVQTFKEGRNHYTCTNNVKGLFIFLGDEEKRCYAGEVGSIIKQQDSLKTEFKAVKRRLATLLQTIDIETDMLGFIEGKNGELSEYYDETTSDVWMQNASLETISLANNLISTGADGMEHLYIAGFSIGTNAAGKTGGAIVKSIAIASESIARGIINYFKYHRQRAESKKFTDVHNEISLKERGNQITKMQLEGHNIAMQYVSIYQQMVQLEMKKQQLLATAQRYSEYYSDVNKNIIEYLIGEPQNYRLRRHIDIIKSEEAYNEALDAAYQTAKAFEYRYNYPYKGSVANKVFQFYSMDDLEGFGDLIYEEAVSRWNFPEQSPQVAKISLREKLLGNVKERFDPETGTALTKGMQFHRKLLSSKYRSRRRNSAGKMVEYIEIPFGLFLQDIEGEDGSKRIIPSDRCLSKIVEVSVETFGNNISTTGVYYKLKRDKYDDMRTCYNVKENDYTNNGDEAKTKIERWDITYDEALKFEADIYTMYEGRCGDGTDPNYRCSTNVFNHRSVASPEWTLVIPFETEANKALLDEDVTIDDINVNIRYTYKITPNQNW